MKIRNVQMIDCAEFDTLVQETYKRPYCFQQQNDCRSRGTWEFTVPNIGLAEDCENDTIPEIVNGPEQGVSFAAWLARDPTQHLNHKDEDSRTEQWAIDLWWHRNFYPDFQTVANDLHTRGLLPAGEYVIDIDW